MQGQAFPVDDDCIHRQRRDMSVPQGINEVPLIVRPPLHLKDPNGKKSG